MVVRRGGRGPPGYARPMPSSATWRAFRSGDLVAVALAPGRPWVPILRAARDAGAAVLPVDVRLSQAERTALIAQAQPTLIVEDAGLRHARGTPIDPAIALVIATSGTGGRPRCAELSRDAVEAAVRASAEVLGAGEEDRWLSCLPLAHIGGLLVVYRHLLLGAPLTFRRSATPRVMAALPEVRFTSMVPTQLIRLLDSGAELRRLRAILVGGSRVDPALESRSAAAGAPVVPTYGMTETCGGVVYSGRPLPGVEVCASPSGELLVRGATLMRRYRLDAAATSAALGSDGWLRTGDGGEVGPDGTVHVWGRLADVIVSGGEKIWPGDVEAALADHPAIAAVMVVGAPDREWGQRVVARIVPRDLEAPPSLEALREHAARTVARHKLPREVIIADHLERTTLGKIRRR